LQAETSAHLKNLAQDAFSRLFACVDSHNGNQH